MNSERQRFETLYASADPYGSRQWYSEQQRFLLVERIFARVGPFGAALEIGSGEGVLSQRLAPYCRSYLSVELSEQAIRRDPGRATNSNRRGWVHGDAFQIGFRPASFDVVIASLVLGYAQAKRDTAAEWCRWLKPGGVLFLVETILPAYFDYDDLLDLVRRLVTIEHLEPVSSKHLIAKLANRRVVPRPSFWYAKAMQWTRANPRRLAKHLCLVGRKH